MLERIEAFQAMAAEMADARNLDAIAEETLRTALELTGSAVAFMGILDEGGKRQQVYSRANEPNRALPAEEIDRLVDDSANGSSAQVNLSYLRDRTVSS